MFVFSKRSTLRWLMGLLCLQRTRSSCSAVAHKYVTLDTESRVCSVFFFYLRQSYKGIYSALRSSKKRWKGQASLGDVHMQASNRKTLALEWSLDTVCSTNHYSDILGMFLFVVVRLANLPAQHLSDKAVSITYDAHQLFTSTHPKHPKQAYKLWCNS